MDANKFTINDIPQGAGIYFIGIGGISMFGLAQLAKDYGFRVGGSDNHPSERTEILSELGITVYNEQVAENIDEFKPDVVVMTAAILKDNKEVPRCQELNIPIFNRAQFLGAITRSHKTVINISGTHGKTTTTSMTAIMMIEAGKEPTVHIGAALSYFDNNTIRLGRGKELLVSEACEYSRSFLEFSSTTAAITNIDHDHVDCYPTIEELIDAFAIYITHCSDDGYVVVTAGDKNIEKAIEVAKDDLAAAGRSFPKVIRCGKDDMPDADVRAVNVTFTEGLPEFDLVIFGDVAGHVKLNVPGGHNVDNSLIAAASAYVNGADPEAIIRALEIFTGADGRYTVKGKYNGCDVVVDYAHHPTAARATIAAAANMPHNDILVIFQPLTFDRTEKLFEDYVTSLLPCKKVLFAEIYTDREKGVFSISSKDIADEINRRGGDAEFYADKMDIIPRIVELTKPGDIILILGPEDVRSLGDVLCPKG